MTSEGASSRAYSSYFPAGSTELTKPQTLLPRHLFSPYDATIPALPGRHSGRMHVAVSLWMRKGGLGLGECGVGKIWDVPRVVHWAWGSKSYLQLFPSMLGYELTRLKSCRSFLVSDTAKPRHFYNPILHLVIQKILSERENVTLPIHVASPSVTSPQSIAYRYGEQKDQLEQIIPHP